MANIRSELFNFNKDGKIISAEASSLPTFYGQSVFGIISQRTGKTAFFQYVKSVRDEEGDLIYQIYAPLTSDSDLVGWRVHIYND